MLPTLVDGEYVLIDGARPPVEGDVVVSHHPRPTAEPDSGLLVIKRVHSIGRDGAVELLSDNPAEGTDSRTWGPVAAELVVGTVTLVLDRPRAGI